MRRAFRFGLSIGLLVGVVLAVAKLVQSRRGPANEPSGWPERAEPWTPQPAPAAAREPVIAEPDAVMLDPDADAQASDATDASDAGATGDADATSKPKSTPRPRTPTKKAPAKKSASAGPTTAKRKPAASTSAWVESSGGECPSSHPVKAKMTSRIFHLPGMLAYNRTRADRCYTDEAAAVGDGFVKAKR